MGPTVHGRFSRHLDSLRQQFLQEGRLPFTDCLSSETVSEAMEQIKGLLERPDLHATRHPVGLSQSDPRRPIIPAARGIARLIANRVDLSQGLPACSSETGAYCQARGNVSTA